MRRSDRICALLTLLALVSLPAGAGVVNACKYSLEPIVGKDLSLAVAGGGTVTFDCPPGTVIKVVRPIILTRSVRILGANRITLDAQGESIFATEAPNLRVELKDITLRNAYRISTAFRPTYRGSMIQGPVDLDLQHVTIRDAIHPVDVAHVTIQDSTFSNIRQVVMRAESLVAVRTSFTCPETSLPFAFVGWQSLTFDRVNVRGCGRIWASGETTIAGSNFSGNLEKYQQLPGAAMQVVGGNVRIENSNFTNNRAYQGGAIYVSWGSLALRRVRFVGNKATGPNGGGAISVDLATPYSPTDVKLEMRYVRFIGNSGAVGGAVAIHEGASARNATVTGDALLFQANSAVSSGGALHVERGGVNFSRPIFVENAAANGGAAYVGQRARMQLGNGLVIRNRAAIGSAFAANALSLVNTTVADNRGIALASAGGTASITLRNTIVSKNVSGNCDVALAAGAVVDAGNNLQFPGAGCGAGIYSIDPLLDTFFVPHPMSAARNAGDNAVCAASPVFARDVYSVHRPLYDRCTIGAVEGDVNRFALPRLRDTPDSRLPRDRRKIKEFIWPANPGHERDAPPNRAPADAPRGERGRAS